jgi:hypothetical protein
MSRLLCNCVIVIGAMLTLVCASTPASGQSAERLYREACDGGDAVSCNVFGIMYETGDGVPLDAARAASLYERACVLGAFAGCVNLGLLHEAGTGADQDLSRARLLYAMACQGGEPLGCERLEALAAVSVAEPAPAARRGRVRHAATGEPLGGTLIIFGEEGTSTISDSQGFFAIPDLPRGTYRLRADHVGYQVTEGQVVLPFEEELVVLITPGEDEDLSAPGRIQGRVTASRGDGLQNVEISVVGQPSARALTNGQGRFTISGVEPGSHELQLALLGYEPRTVNLIVHPGRLTEVDASLSTDVIELEPIQVVVRSGYLERNGFYRRQRARTGGGRFFERADIEDMGASELSDVVRRVPGLRVSRSGFSTVAQSRRSISWGLDTNFDPNGQGIFTRGVQRRSTDNGRPPCVLAVYVDGVPTFDSDLDWLPVSQIQAVEVYSSGLGAPIMFTVGGATCGAVAVWTRR